MGGTLISLSRPRNKTMGWNVMQRFGGRLLEKGGCKRGGGLS